jgi:hypothetical protein
MPPKSTLRQRFRQIKPFLEMAFGFVLAVSLAETAIHVQWIAEHFTGTTRIITILAACYVLYLIRDCSPLTYGTLEIVVGLSVIVGIMVRKPEQVDPGLLLVQLAAGMYVIIRGFENLAKSSPFPGPAALSAAAFRALRDLMRRKKPNKDPSRPLQ